jgi:hypothetical protein
MKKLIAAGIAGAALLVTALPVLAGAKNATFVKFTYGTTEYDSYWMTTGSGLVHEWRFDEGGYDLHFVFKPASKFEAPDCDTENLFTSMTNWTYSIPPYGEVLAGDEAQLADYLTEGDYYHVCYYRELAE